MKNFLPSLFILLAAAPAAAQTGDAAAPTYSAVFEPASVSWAAKPGKNTITGDAVLRTRGGDVKTCAGLNAQLLPASPQTEEFVRRAFGSTTGGYAGSLNVDRLKLEAALDPRLAAMTQKKKCNSQGIFTFSNLADGSYYVIVTVRWEAPRVTRYSSYMSTQGGDLAQLVTVKGGQTETITLTE